MPLVPVDLVRRRQVLAVVDPVPDAVPVQHLGDGRAPAVALVDLVHGQPCLHVLLRLPIEDPLAAVGAEVEPLAAELAAPDADRGRVARLGEAHRDLADLAQHRQALEEEALALFLEAAGALPQRSVVPVEGVRVDLRHPVELLARRHGGVEVRRVAELVEDPVDLVAHVLLLGDRLLDVPRRADPVVLQVREEPLEHLLLHVELERLLPAHDLLREHVVHHRRDQAEQPVPAPEPLVDPVLDDRDVALVLLEHELDDLEPERHVPALVALRGEAEGHRGQVAVEARPAHERHEQQVGQQVLEAERDRGQELERAGRNAVLEERLRHAQVPHPVVHLGEVVHSAVVLVVLADRVGLGLRVAQLVDALAQRREPAPGPVEVAGQVAEVPVGRVLQGRHPAQEQLERVDVAGVGQRQVALPLGEAVDDGVELLVLLRLVLAVRVDRQPERVLPLVPVVDLDALVAGVGVDVFRLDVGGCPVEVAGEQSVPLPHRQLGLGHGSLLGSGMARGRGMPVGGAGR